MGLARDHLDKQSKVIFQQTTNLRQNNILYEGAIHVAVQSQSFMAFRNRVETRIEELALWLRKEQAKLG